VTPFAAGVTAIGARLLAPLLADEVVDIGTLAHVTSSIAKVAAREALLAGAAT